MSDHPSPRPRRRFRRRRAASPPREPFFKDARVLKRLRFDVSLRVLLAALIVFVAVATVMGVYIIDSKAKTDRLVSQLDEQNARTDDAVAELQELRRQGRADRLASERELKRQLRMVGCSLWNSLRISKSKQFRRIAADIDRQYNCVPLHLPLPPGARPSSTPSSASSGATSSISVSPGPGSGNSASSAPRASRSPAPRPSSTVRGVGPAPTRPPGNPDPSPSRSGLVDLGPILCPILGVDC